jgi:hypothetical protein
VKKALVGPGRLAKWKEDRCKAAEEDRRRSCGEIRSWESARET